jgi:hypothetical protein
MLLALAICGILLRGYQHCRERYLSMLTDFSITRSIGAIRKSTIRQQSWASTHSEWRTSL